MKFIEYMRRRRQGYGPAAALALVESRRKNGPTLDDLLSTALYIGLLLVLLFLPNLYGGN